MPTLDQLLVFAVRGRNTKLVRERLAAGADPSGDDGGALFVAINTSQVEMIHLLMGCVANIHITDRSDYGALEYALRIGDAVEAGAKQSVLCSTAMGYSLYSKLGYTLLAHTPDFVPQAVDAA